MNFRKTIFATAFTALLTLSACSASLSSSDQPESALPDSVDLVVAFDYSNDFQRTAMENLLDKFPEMPEMKAAFMEGFNSEMDSESLSSFEEDVLPILKSKWKLVIGFDVEDIDVSGSWNGEGLYVAAYFEEIDLVEEKILPELKLNGEFEAGDSKEEWKVTSPEDDYFFARHGNLVFFAQEANYEVMKALVSGGEGAFEQPDFAKSNVMYIHANFDTSAEKLVEVFKLAQEEVLGDAVPGYAETIELLETMESIEAVVSVENDGIRFYEEIVLADTELARENFPSDLGASTFADKVPVGNPILYAEDVSGSALLKGFFEGFYSTVEYIERDSYQEGLSVIAENVGVSSEDVEAFFSGPVSIVMSDVDSYYPAIALYLAIDEENLGIAEDFELAMDGFVDVVLQELEAELALEGSEAAGVIKREAVVVNGAGFHRVYLDWEALPAEFKAQTTLLPGLTETEIALYYGLTSDNVFAVALYPGFADVYGEETLSDSDLYRQIKGSMTVPETGRVSFFASGPMIDMVQRYIDVAEAFGALPADDPDVAIVYEMLDLFRTFKYVANFVEIEGSVAKAEVFISIEELKE